jgi:predicted lipid-binding transport protein (Tim44 family)
MQFDPAIVIFAFLALFVLWKLRSVLGERTGFEQRRDLAPAPQSPPAQRKLADENARWKDFAERGSPLWSGLEQIAQSQPGFEPGAFLSGAIEAYKMVVGAFSAGDRATLRSLTSDDVFASFEAALAQRAQNGETLETTFLDFKDVKIVTAVSDRIGARMAVSFDAQFLTVTRDRKGEIIEGDPDKPSNITDIWTFARRHDAGGPNWTLVATSP